jgi:putative methionine-R-sulfoxide reductase with GAF domain
LEQLSWSRYSNRNARLAGIMTVPMTREGELKGVLYLSASIKVKEFDAGQYNFIKTLCEILSRIF